MEIYHNACAKGIAGHAKVSRRMIRDAGPLGVIPEGISVGVEVAQAGRSTGIHFIRLKREDRYRYR